MTLKPIFEKPNILITGGAGFIGSHLCDELIKTAKVVCLDNFISGDERNIDHLLQNPNFEFIRHDIIQPIDLLKFPELEKFKIKFQGIQEIYHLACPTSPKNFENTKLETILTNSLGTKNALDLAVKFKAKFLLSSSSVIYGSRTSKNYIFKETDLGTVNPVSPRACYDEGKRFAETLVSTYREVYNLDAKIARIFRTYGSRMKLNDGQMIPDFVSSAIEHKDLVIYGDKNFSTSLCHVSDIVGGLIKFMKSGEAGLINFGGDQDLKIVAVAKKIIELTKSKSKIIFSNPLLFMTPLGLPDITLAKEKLGWFPVVLLADGISEAIDYFKAHRVLLTPDSRFKK